MIYKIRVADIPIFIIAVVISIPVIDGFIELVKQDIDPKQIPRWVFMVGFVVVVVALLWLSDVIWKQLQKMFRLGSR